MEERRTIREYLDNPRLLTEITIEQLQLWADEVPYAAIIHQLMAMKVVQEEHTPASREILQRATLQSPNPDRLSRQLHRLASDVSKTEISHTYPDKEAQISTSASADPSLEVEKTIIPKEEINVEANKTPKPIEEVISSRLTKEEESVPLDEEYKEKDENELSDFSQWLSGLKKVQDEGAKKEKGSSILEGHTDIASETLAELLVKQGHTSRAIEMYEQLSLKYPKKSSFFAGQIQKIQGL